MDFYEDNRALYHRAVSDFQDARRKAALENLLAFLQRKPIDLMSYDVVRQRLSPVESASRRLQEIPLDQIVGSVNRYSDFTRTFLPRQASDVERWARVRLGVENMKGLPPIEAYQVGDVYFVLDGHHRVSVARELGAKTIEGYVIPVYTRVPLSPGDSPDDLIIKSEYSDFLAKTHIDDLRPDANLLVTAPGQYQKLLEHINVHKYFMGQRLKRDISDDEAITDWYDTVYEPIARLIRDRNLLRDFPNRTETDLYLWLMDHRAALGGGGLGWEVSPEAAARDLSARYSPTHRLARLSQKVAHAFVPDPLESGPPPGQWRAEHQSPRRGDRLFDDLLVAVPSTPSKSNDWPAINLAIEIARREEARLTGLHAVQSEAEKDSPYIKVLQDNFLHRCAEAGIFGRFLVEVGGAAELVCQRSPWVDLAIFRLNYPPPAKRVARLRSGTRLLIRRCSTPILAVPDSHFNLNSAVLAYGPGAKANEALFVATYLAGRWNIPLTVVAVKAQGKVLNSPTALERARTYLEEHGIKATYVEETGDIARDPARAVLLNAESHNADFIIMGGYESSPLREAIWGSTVDRVLRSTRRPVLICR